jgi:hypothetical protein
MTTRKDIKLLPMRSFQFVRHLILCSFIFLLSIVLTSSAAADSRFLRVSDPVPGQYIVRLASVDADTAHRRREELAESYQGRVHQKYSHLFHGFVIELPEPAARALSRDHRVMFVEEVAFVYSSGEDVLGEISTNFQNVGTDQGLWHLDRSDQRQIDDGGLDGVYAWCSSPNQVKAYVVDTGVRKTHSEFAAGQVEQGYDAMPLENGTADDPCQSVGQGGHGTAVASVVGGETYGYSKFVKIVPVRVKNCSGMGTTATLVDGLDWIKGYGVLRPDATEHRAAIINMSIFTDHSQTLLDSLWSLKNQGYVIFTSANNFPAEDACTRAPAMYARGNGGPVITVGGTMIGQLGDAPHNSSANDYRWQNYDGSTPLTDPGQGSSYGPCVDIWAPAKNIRVALYTTETNSIVLSGTSFSAPLVAGMVIQGYLRSIVAPNSSTPDSAWNWLLNPTTNSGATTHDSFGSILVRDGKTTPHGRTAFYLQGCRRRLVQ